MSQLFTLQAPYTPSPDQEKAIREIVDFVES
jgi:excinuclease UvrABC helicase subunit UvrB